MLKGFRGNVENFWNPWVSQKGSLAYLEKELALGKGHRVIKRPVAVNTQV